MNEPSPMKHVDTDPIDDGPKEIAPIVIEPLSVAEMKTQVDHVQQTMRAVMKEGEHYGTIPGCGPKPALLKSGAEKLGMVFRLVAKYKITEKDMGDGHIRFMVETTLRHKSTNEIASPGVGICSTLEKKYREYKDGRPRRPEDQYNTVLKMAKKRSHVDAIITATAASDIFTQDIEDAGGNSHDAERVGALEKHGRALQAKIETLTALNRCTNKLVFDLAKRLLESACDEGDMKEFSALGKRIKVILDDDRVKLLGEMYEQRMNEFQETNGEGKAD